MFGRSGKSCAIILDVLVAQSGKSATLRRLRSRVRIASSTPILFMKHLRRLFAVTLLAFSVTGCDIFSDLFDTDTIHNHSYEPATGKFVLYEALDKRITDISNTYFEIDGKNFTLKYYVNGELKKDGKIQKLLTRSDYIGYYCDSLHFNVKVGKTAEHICTYSESLDPINQFRIIEEYYYPGDALYYLSELPYILGTYVREGQQFVAEKPHKNDVDYLTPTDSNFSAAIDGKYALDDNHYFYFLNPRAWKVPNGSLIPSYFQYFSSELTAPIEGFIYGYSTEYNASGKTFYMRTYRDSVDWGEEGKEGRIIFGYHTFENGRMFDHYGEIDYSNGVMNSFTFEHLSRQWTEKEWGPYEKGIVDEMPDAVLYDYVGGTYMKV